MAEKKENIFGTKEWAVATYNTLSGCYHNCKYCYAKSMAIRFKRKTEDSWEKEEKRDLKKFKAKKIDGTVMYPSTHDITPENIEVHIDFLRKLLEVGNDLLIVSKPHLSCIKKICDEFSNYKDNILFRFTIGSSNSELLKKWEPNAPDFNERLESVKYAFENGYKTSISCEPMLDDNIYSVIDLTDEYVTDSIWLGKLNSGKARLKFNKCFDEMKDELEKISNFQCNEKIFRLYNKYKDNPKIKWKESIKKVVGIELPKEKGLDI